MIKRFPIFQSHIDWAHSLWKLAVAQGDIVVDATCGNGYDTIVLAKYVLASNKGSVYAIDIQEQAIENTKQYLLEELPPNLYQRIHFFQMCHSTFPNDIPKGEVSLIVYNLGYLPKGSKELTTRSESTLTSIQQAMKLIKEGGCISITCYPGHLEGEREEKLILQFLENLDPQIWNICYHRWINRKKPPSLLWIQKGQPSILPQ